MKVEFMAIDAKRAADEGIEYRLVPHRNDESKNSEASFCWKLEKWQEGLEEDGLTPRMNFLGAIIL